MKKGSTFRDVIVVGFAMFAIFFGAGNLIFPPHIGLQAGAGWGLAMLGMLLTGIILPVLAIVAVANMGSQPGMFRPLGKWVYLAFTAILLYTGSMAAIIPRTGALAYESGTKVLLPGVDQGILMPATIIAYFLIAAFFAINRSKVIDYVGQFLTPVLLILLVTVVVWGLVQPIGTPTGGVENPFYMAFTTSYQTGDVATGLVTGGLFIAALNARGYKTTRQRLLPLIGVAAVAAALLFIVYGGLEFLGAQGSSMYNPEEITESELLNALIARLGGPVATNMLALAVVFACLTTAIGMATVISGFTEELTRGKIPYKVAVVIITIVFIVQAMGGVSYIINFLGPIVAFLYPFMIIMVILGLAKKIIPNDGVWIGAVLGGVIIGIYDAVNAALANFADSSIPENIHNVYLMLPAASMGMAWILPAIVLGVIFGIIWKVAGLPSWDGSDEDLGYSLVPGESASEASADEHAGDRPGGATRA